MNNFENSKDIHRNNIEKKNWNWLKEKWESIKTFLEWKKDVDEIRLKEETSERTEKLKDSTIDSTLDSLNLEMQEWLELSNSDIETKDELNQFFEKGKNEFKDEKAIPQEKELSQQLLKNNKFKNRSPEAVREIAHSDTKLENEIKNWKQEKNPVAKSLLRVVDRIIWTEK